MDPRRPHSARSPRTPSPSIAIALLAPLASGGEDERVFPGAIVPSGSGTVDVALGDLDGDGFADALAANATGGDVAVHLGGGFADLGGAASYATGATPGGVDLGDLDGDGRPDAVTSLGGAVSGLRSYLTAGDGTLVELATHGGGLDLGRPRLGDWNGDGALDVAVPERAGLDVLVRLGLGDGTFGAASSVPVGAGPDAVAAGDLDGDGLPDLAVSTGSPGSIELRLGDGAGGFASGGALAVVGSARGVAVADLDGDQVLDVATTVDPATGARVWLGTGGGEFGAPQAYDTSDDPRDLGFADLDGDGVRDLFVVSRGSEPDGGGSNRGAIGIRPGIGDGTFGAEVRAAQASGHERAAPMDLDGDGDVDLVVASSSVGELRILENDGAGGFPAPLVSTRREPEGVASGDFDGDGVPDLAVTATKIGSEVDPDGRVRVRLGAGDGSFVDGESLVPGALPTTIESADLDLDWHLDLVVLSRGSNRIGSFLGAGDGTFAPGSLISPGPEVHHFDVGDADGDGTPDLVTSPAGLHQEGRVYFGAGDGSFAPAAEAFPLTLAVVFEIEFVDFDADGLGDFLVTLDLLGVLGMRGNGDGSVDSSVGFTEGIGDTATGAVLADFSGDGQRDLLVSYELGSGDFVAKLAEGIGPFDYDFDGAAEIPLSFEVFDLVAFDADVDGHLDVVGASAADQVVVLLGDGSGSLGPARGYTAADEVTDLATADFDGDGRLDVAAVGKHSRRTAILLNRSDPGPLLAAGPATVSLSAGGAQTLRLRAGAEHAGGGFFLLGSITGTSPGTPIGPFLAPLNYDAYFQLVLGNPAAAPLFPAIGPFDAEACAVSAYALAAGTDPIFAGTEVAHAYLTLTAEGAVTGVSNAVFVELVP